MNRPVALIILDGYGIAPPGPGNAVRLAATPVFDRLLATFPNGQLAASGRAVGLPDGQMGNSEVGHLTIGAGRIVRQDLVRLSDAVEDGSLLENPALVAAARRARDAGRPLHVSGLVSDGGVHSHVDHMRAVVELAGAQGARVAVHAVTDGRDVSPHQAAGLLRALDAEWGHGAARFATVSGRMYAMDRDRRWERTKRFYDAIAHGVGATASTAAEAVDASYAAGVTDEFVEPAVIGDPAADRVQTGDEFVFFNFRPDRARQICHALADPEFGDFDRGGTGPVSLTAMTRYWDGQPGAVAFGPEWPQHVLADAIEAARMTQLHAAETEKYPHVTYFLNGGREQPHAGEERILVPSPRDVRTYDERPSMSAPELAARVADALRTTRPDFTVVNFANPDMVGHTGIIPAVIEAIETADTSLGVVLDALTAIGGVAIVTSDHGNAEHMLEPDGQPHTAHTTNPVPVVLTDTALELRPTGGLSDLAPTLLALLGIETPAEMTGTVLTARLGGERG
jgi:2,3-bisphosphoglycerate-independent phosphoglycerate mutase